MLSRNTLQTSVFLIAAIAAGFAFTPPVFAQTAGYALSIDETSIEAGEAIVVSWQAPSAVTRSKDWVGLYRPGAGNNSFLAWKYIPDTGTSGNISLSYNIPGSYEVRLFTDNGFTRVATAVQQITITPVGPNLPTGTYTLSLTAGTYAPNAPVTVRFTAPASRTTTRDWVGMYRQEANDRAFVDWKYIPDDEDEGSLTFNISREGTYEARLFTNNGFTKVATAANTFIVSGGGNGTSTGTSTTGYTLTVSPLTINAGESITASYGAPSSANRSRDWVGLYRTNGSDRAFVDWEYVGSGSTGSITFTPPAAGTYNVRYFKNNGYTRVATSQQITVTAQGGGGGQCTVADLDEVTNFPPANGPIVAFGDSLTAGVGATTDQDYVSQLERKAGVNIINEGVSGDTTEEALDRLQSDVLARDPSVVIVWLGGNDIIGRFYERARDGLEDISTVDWLKLVALRLTGKIPDTTGITEDETFENLTEIIERIQAGGAVTIVVGFSGGIIDEDLEGRYEAVAESTGSLYVPDALDNIIGRPSLMSDLVHPDNDGYAIVADRVLPYLQCAIP